MITEKDLEEAIAQCQGVIKPTSSTCVKLASYLTIKDHMFGLQEKEPVMRQNTPIFVDVIEYDSGSEFSRRVSGKRILDVISVIDELMETLQVVNPRLYNSVIDRF